MNESTKESAQECTIHARERGRRFFEQHSVVVIDLVAVKSEPHSYPYTPILPSLDLDAAVH